MVALQWAGWSSPGSCKEPSPPADCVPSASFPSIRKQRRSISVMAGEQTGEIKVGKKPESYCMEMGNVNHSNNKMKLKWKARKERTGRSLCFSLFPPSTHRAVHTVNNEWAAGQVEMPGSWGRGKEDWGEGKTWKKGEMETKKLLK